MIHLDATNVPRAPGTTGIDAVRQLTGVESAVGVRVDGELRDVRLPLPAVATVELLTTEDSTDPDALFVLRHSAAHVLAEAVRRLYPGVKIAIGPPIEGGFYYDFDFPRPVDNSDLDAIEAEMRTILAEGRSWTRLELSRDEARARLLAEGEEYKLELLEAAEGQITFYQQGDFIDLCRGPHLLTSAPIVAVKLLSVSGAYWRGDSSNRQLTRIYGTAFFTAAELEARLVQLEAQRARDHRRLGSRLDLFHFEGVSPGSPFWHGKGMAVWNELEDVRRGENRKRGYTEVKTPVIFERALWEQSGHWDKFRDAMFFLRADNDRLFGLKPMNCPGHCLIFRERPRSHRDLPLRLAEAGTLHRDEPSGALHGLLRVRHITQDDGHIFCRADQVEEEVFGCLDYAFYLYELLGLDMRVELSLRPEDKLGSDRDWDKAEGALRAALQQRGIAFAEIANAGAFYGPKIDMHMQDSLGRSWQLGTIQLDFQMPRRFELAFHARENKVAVPVMIHRAIFGSLERFIGILIEHLGGEFPLWLAPIQVRIITVAERHRDAAAALARQLATFGRVDVDDRDDTVGRRIREAELEKIPLVVVYGDRESDDRLAVRMRDGGLAVMTLTEVAASLAQHPAAA